MSDNDPMEEFRIAVNRYDEAKNTLREATEQAQKAYQRLYDLYAEMLEEMKQ